MAAAATVGGSADLRIVSLNVAANSTHFGGLLGILTSVKPHLVFLQEVACRTVDLENFVAPMGYSAFCNVESEGGRALGTAVVWGLGLGVDAVNVASPNRILEVVCGRLTFLNVYAPAGKSFEGQRRAFFGQDLLRAIRGAGRAILVGDWNAIVDDRDTEANAANKRSQVLLELVRDLDYVDGWRQLNPVGREFTWFRRGLAASRLDRVYVPREWFGLVTAVEHLPSLSDHWALSVAFSSSLVDVVPVEGFGCSVYWKLNSQILKEEDWQANFKELWEECLGQRDDFVDVATWWDVCFKPRVKAMSAYYSARRKRIRVDTMQFLYNHLGRAMRRGDWGAVVSLRARIQGMFLEDSWGFVVRSRYKQNVEEEMASLYHVNREKRHGARNNISKLSVTGAIVEEREEVERHVLGFFEPLFSGAHDDRGVDTGRAFVPDDTFLEDFLVGLPRLSVASAGVLEQVVSLDELSDVLKSLPTGKSPGLDGLSYEFYVAVFPIIKVVLLEVLQCILDQGDLTASMKKGVTRLLPKVDGVPAVDELRPITLLATDYKILAKILVQRMMPILPDVISSGQLCSVGSANILDGAVGHMSGLIHAGLGDRVGPLGLVSLDQWKAFDRVYIPFLLLVLERMGFGDKWLMWMAMLHAENLTCFILGSLSRPIDLLFSVRQGDPIALILYLVFVEPLLLRLKDELPGIKVGGGGYQYRSICG